MLHAYSDGVWKVQMFGVRVLAWSSVTCVGDMCVQRDGVHAYVWRTGVRIGHAVGWCVHALA